MWFTADWHLYHTNIIKYVGRKFRSVDHMHNVIVDKVNDLVAPNEDLYILGDLTLLGPKNWRAIKQILDRIDCRKHLVLGNHDTFKPFKYVEIGFVTVHTAVKVEEFWLMHDPAMATVLDRNIPVLCGHVHDLFIKQRNCLNVGVDVWNFEPVHIEVVRGMFEQE